MQSFQYFHGKHNVGQACINLIAYSTVITRLAAAELGRMVTSDFCEVLMALKDLAEKR
jgi:hypothetical protein